MLIIKYWITQVPSYQFRVKLIFCCAVLEPLTTSPTKWSNTLKQLVSNFCKLFECVWPFCGVGDSRVNDDFLHGLMKCENLINSLVEYKHYKEMQVQAFHFVEQKRWSSKTSNFKSKNGLIIDICYLKPS